NTKTIAILVSAIAVTAIALFSTRALTPHLTPTSSCNTENSNLLAGSFTASQTTPYTYTVKVHNAQSEAVKLTSYRLETQSYSIDIAISAGQNGTFTTVQDPNSETWIPVKTSCGNQFTTTFVVPSAYVENIAPTSATFQDSTQVAVDLQNNG